jgi:hypothetical protein
MKAKIIDLFLLTMIVQSSFAQQPPTETIKTSTNNILYISLNISSVKRQITRFFILVINMDLRL